MKLEIFRFFFFCSIPAAPQSLNHIKLCWLLPFCILFHVLFHFSFSFFLPPNDVQWLRIFSWFYFLLFSRMMKFFIWADFFKLLVLTWHSCGAAEQTSDYFNYNKGMYLTPGCTGFFIIIFNNYYYYKAFKSLSHTQTE